MARSKKKSAGESAASSARGPVQLYTMEVILREGPVTEEYVEENPTVTRTIQIRGDQTLEDLHNAIFDAFDRFDEHMYEFQLRGKGPNDPTADRYVLPMVFDSPDYQMGKPVAGRVDKATIGSLRLGEGEPFGYWFDFGDSWWHQVNVLKIENEVPRGKYPKVIERVGASPPQYPDMEDEEEYEDEGEK